MPPFKLEREQWKGCYKVQSPLKLTLILPDLISIDDGVGWPLKVEPSSTSFF